MDMIRGRDRNLDKKSRINQTFFTQEYFINAAKSYCKEKHIPHVLFENEANDVQTAADELLNHLINKKILCI
jgi:hypothetical protein